VDAKLAELDGTRFRERLGVNTMIAVSMVGARVAGFQRLLTRCSGACPQAVCRAGARAARLPLYRHIATLSGYVRAQFPLPGVQLRGRCHACADDHSVERGSPLREPSPGSGLRARGRGGRRRSPLYWLIVVLAGWGCPCLHAFALFDT
jgi:hypothetical protein